jgi:hypothetical protein
MRSHKLGLLAALLIFAAACGGAKPSPDASMSDAEGGVSATEIWILPFTPPELTLRVNETHDQWVNLSRPAEKTTYVDLVNSSASVTASPLTLAYTTFEDQQKVTITALSDTADTFVPLRFLLRGTKSARTLQVKVVLW